MIIKKAMDTTLTRTTYCYSYHRISTKRQLKGGGIERQLEASAAFCEEKGWAMDTTFQLTDIGKSAFHGRNLDDKAALGSFLNAVDQGLIKRPAVLLVESLDRISRANIMDALELFIRILNTGITICTYIDRMVYSKEELQNNFAPLIISITLMCRSHDESEVKSRRIKSSWKQMREKAKNNDGLMHKHVYPAWIDISSGEPKLIEEKAAMVREAFDLCINQDMSYALITNHLHEKYGQESITRRAVKLLFQTKRALGIYEPTKSVVENGVRKVLPTYEEIKLYPAVIEEETYFAARASIAKRQSLKSGRPSNNDINFFRKILLCGCCGSGMTMTNSGKSSLYKCNRKVSYRLDCSQQSVLTVSKFQPVLLKAIALIDKDDLMVSASNRKKTKLTQELNAKQALLKDKQTKIDNLAELVAAGSKKGIQMVVELENEIESVHQDIATVEEQLASLASPMMAASLEHTNSFHLRFQLNKATRDDQLPFMEALRNTVEKIVIHSPEKEGQRTLAVIHLLSGIEIMIEVFNNYSANLYKEKKLLLRIEGGQTST